jgi:uncharacterized membrane protein YfcA
VSPDWLAFPAGICIATVVMLVGFGGGMLWMPFLLIVLKLPPETAIITSLVIQTAGTASGSVANMMQRATDNRLTLLLLVIALPGVELGAYIAHNVFLSRIELLVGLIALTTAFLFVATNQKYADVGEERVNLRKSLRVAWAAAVMAIVSGLLTVNIGEWLVPIMRKKMGLRMRNAIATVILLTCGISFAGAIIHYTMGARPDWHAALWAIPGVVIGGQIGSRLMRRIDERLLKEMFIFVLTLIGIHLVYNYFPG